jgi:hypothetical protein
VRWDLTGFFIRRANGTTTFDGTDAEALEFSVRVKKHFDQLSLRMVQARSVAPIDSAVPDARVPREVAKLRPHRNRRDWTADQLRLHHGREGRSGKADSGAIVTEDCGIQAPR